ncbi:hypothetical protein BRM3_04870 [Brachybacterium huguangmaarense]|uniref:Uncharacterized protein n=1 Tax=Brachybacterium huguangmaarense TaxID=1652028 RepID=A0ABY6G3S3_9MICO|nr:hypothetical protein [Brachybacterium huguangmaarense]UYG17757.1 hypothetical protein BRM3_04870 [Brachybacterium huguangmaarense]
MAGHGEDTDGSAWTARDQTLLRTAQIIHAIEHGEYDRIDALDVDFAVHGSFPDNKIVLAAPCELYSYQALGDGSYTHDSSMFLATGRGGLAMTAGVAAGRAIGNSRRRAAAARDATPHWHRIDGGLVFVNQFGFYLSTPTNLLWWNWDSILSGRMLARRQFALLGESETGRVNYVVESDAAELVFAFWAMVRQSRHSQLAQRVWLLPEWLAKYRAHLGDRAFDFTAPPGPPAIES